MKKRFFLLTFGILFVIACNAAQPSAPANEPANEPAVSEPASPRLSPTAEANPALPPATESPASSVTAESPASSPTTESVPPPAVVSGKPTATNLPPSVGFITFTRGTRFLTPTGMATGVTLNPVPASLPSSSGDLPYWEIYPEHLQFDFNGYVLKDTFHQPRIIVYPANEYAKINEGARTVILDLQNLLANPGAPLPKQLPFLPLFNAGQVFHSNEVFFRFQNGAGIRYLTQYAQAPYPANNRDLFYTFQAITDDGAYYVAAIMPINIGFLPLDGEPNTPLPSNGVPFDWNNYENTQTHFDLVAQKLNDASPAEFLPSLTTLDAAMQSILAEIK